jgi:CubicO group peptidase (beta-lactamase class C family)
MTKDALFRIASMTKPITAIGIMILVDEGKLSVDDPVEKHLPEFKGQMLVANRTADAVTLTKPPRPITVRDLLTHTSGLPGAMPPGLSDLYVKRNHTLAEAVMAFSQRPLEFEPGKKWSYCNPGIDTLGRIIEVVSGQPYEEFLRKRIFEPLEMTDTTFYPGKELLGRLAQTCDRKDGRLVPATNMIIELPAGARYPIPAGGLYSTGADLSRLYRMMLNRGTLGKVRILSEDSVSVMTRVQTGDMPAAFTPGMGFGYERSEKMKKAACFQPFSSFFPNALRLGGGAGADGRDRDAVVGQLRPRRRLRHAGLARPGEGPVHGPPHPARRPAQLRRLEDAPRAAGARRRGGEEVNPGLGHGPLRKASSNTGCSGPLLTSASGVCGS